jgi:hypothetical protein
MKLWKKLVLATLFNASIAMVEQTLSDPSWWMAGAFSLLTYGSVLFIHWTPDEPADAAVTREREAEAVENVPCGQETP